MSLAYAFSRVPHRTPAAAVARNHVTGALRPALLLTTRRLNQRRLPPTTYLPAKPGAWRGFRTARTSCQEPSGAEPRRSTGKTRRKPTALLLRLVLRATQAVVLLLAFNVLSDATGLSATILSWLRGRPLNETRFVPFTITSREQVSPTAFVLTLRPSRGGDPDSPLLRFFRATHADSPAAAAAAALRGAPSFYWPLFLRAPHASGPALAAAWSHGLWSVEVRQPQLQVAREYTPLPPRAAAAAVDAGEVRLLVRRLRGGEVSSYLAGLRAGDAVDLRGPHLGPDARARLGPAPRAVFVAAGTGVAPALQLAAALLDGGGGVGGGGGPPTSSAAVELLWANRRRADCDGGSVVAQLADLAARHGPRFRVRCVVDEEGSFVAPADIARAVGGVGAPGGAAGEGPCRVHSQEWVARRPARELEGERCECVAGADGARGAGGRSLLFVSGPEGFIETYAGRKVWARGQELQGPVGGVIGDLQRRCPAAWKDWLVFKL